MGNLSILLPEYLIAICEFTYASRGRTRYIPNDVRRFLVGEAMQTSRKKRPGLPEIVARKFKSEILVPIYFSLIKHPVRLGRGRLANAAVGAIIIYRTSVADRDSFKQLCSVVSQELKRRFEEFKIIAGYGMEIEQ